MANSARLGIAVLTVVFSGLGTAAAQIDEIRNIDGKDVECFHSGLMSDLNDCGFKSDWYDYVFVGSISAIIRADKDEKKIKITPEELFYGDPPSPLTVLTSQALCLPKLVVGDRWLFFLQQQPGRPIVLDYYGNASLPVANAQQQIETLRRLKTIGDFGLVRGKVERGDLPDSKAVSGARVVASRKSDHAQFFSTTDDDGVFEFEPLSPNKYDLTVDPVGTFHPDDDSVEVTRGSCSELTMRRSPHGRISGHIRRSDGSPVLGAGVFIMDEDGYNAEMTDKEGYFHSDGMRPGKYVVGVNLATLPRGKYVGCQGKDCAEPIIDLYYPGMLNRADSLVITLADDEKRDDIDFVIPTL